MPTAPLSDGSVDQSEDGGEPPLCVDASCGEHARCTGVAGRAECACDPGFADASGASASCIDIDECATDPCGEHQVCTNEIGRFRCSCAPGFVAMPGGECAEEAACRVNDPSEDPEQDGVAARCDNCPHDKNPAQVDIDRDGFGWACDPVTQLPRTLVDAALRFDGALPVGASVRSSLSVQMLDDSALLWFGPNTGAAPGGSSVGPALLDEDFLVLDGSFGLTSRDLPVREDREYEGASVAGDGTVFLSGKLAGQVVAPGRGDLMPFGDGLTRVRTFLVGKDSLVQVESPAQVRLYRWVDGATELLIGGANRIEIERDADLTVTSLMIIATMPQGKVLQRYDSVTHSLTTLASVGVEGELVLLGGLPRVYCYRSGPSSIASFVYDSPEPIEVNDVPGSGSCSYVSLASQDDKRWLSARSCPSCPYTHLEQDRVIQGLPTDATANGFFEAGDYLYAVRDDRTYVRAPGALNFSPLSVTARGGYRKAPSFVRGEHLINAWTLYTEADTHVIVADVVGVSSREFAFTIPGRVFSVGVLPTTDGAIYVWDRSSDSDAGLWFGPADGTAPAAVLPQGNTLTVTELGARTFLTHGTQFYAVTASGLTPVTADSEGNDLASVWGLAGRHAVVGTAREDQPVLLQLTRQNGKLTLGTWADGVLTLPSAGAEDDLTDLSELNDLQQAISAEDGTPWVWARTETHHLLMAVPDRVPVVKWRAPISRDAGAVPVRVVIRDGRVLALIQDDAGAHVFRLRSDSLEELPAPLSGVPAHFEWPTESWLPYLTVDGVRVFCSWPLFDRWATEPRACTKLPFPGGEVLTEPVSAWWLARSDAQIGALVRDQAGETYLMRLPLRLP